MGACISKRKASEHDGHDSNNERQRLLTMGDHEDWQCYSFDRNFVPSDSREQVSTKSPRPLKNQFNREHIIDRLQTIRTMVNFNDNEIHELLRLIESNARLEISLATLQEEIRQTRRWVAARKIKKHYLERLTEEIINIEQISWAAQALLINLRHVRDSEDKSSLNHRLRSLKVDGDRLYKTIHEQKIALVTLGRAMKAEYIVRHTAVTPAFHTAGARHHYLVTGTGILNQ